MNFGKLLGAGKSFISGRGGIAYREDKRVYLPKFNSEKNPFAPKPAEPSVTAAVEPEKAVASVAAKTQKISTVPAPSWTEKLNPFRAVKPVTAPAPVATVQVELSLDAVKVVHNDLSDADVEVVPMKSRCAESSATPASSAMEFMGEPVLRTT